MELLKTLHIPLVILHVFGAAIIVGSTFLALIVVFRKSLTKETISLFGLVTKVVTFAIYAQIITGILLFINEFNEFINSGLFWAKMIVFVIDGILAVTVIDKKIQSAKDEKESMKKYQDTANLRVLNFLLLCTIVILGIFLSIPKS